MTSLITRTVLIASLALSVSPAMAAAPARTAVPHRAAVHTAARPADDPLNANIGQFIQSMLGGGPVQYSGLVRAATRAAASRGSAGSSDWSPSYDYSSATDTSSAANDAQTASDAENQAIQSMNDTNAMTASMAAAEQENDAANAAALQTELNANN
jgi:hypothetical protein